MHSVNDDMDDLWRKAGNEYPLKSDGADWDKVAAKLGLPPAPPAPQRRDRRYLWLLLLLLIPVICVRPFPLGIGSGTDEKTPTAQQSGTPLQRTPASTHPDRTAGTAGSAPTAGTVRPAAAADNASAGDRSSTDAVPSQNTNPVSPAVATKPPIAGGAQSGRQSGTNPLSRRASAASLRRQVTSSPVAVASRRNAAQSRQKNRDKDSQGADTITVAAPVPIALVPATTAAAGNDSATQPSRAVAAAAAAVDSTAAVAPAAAKKPAQRVSRLYAGVVAGAGITTVKGQKVEAPGYDLGVAIGYQASRQLAVEAQLLWSRKHYYSSGAYVGKSPGYMPLYSNIKSVDGDCRMFEIPVALRYDFHLRKRGNWFASAGVSSYLMKREDYGYVLHYGMTNYDGYHDTTYRNASRDWAAVLQLSAGYRLALPRSYSLRFEPYVQVPLRNAGAGSLPLTSAGIRLLFSRPLGGKEPRRY